MAKSKKTWKVCEVLGYITAVDPGRLTTSSSDKKYRRDELYKGMNLCGYDDDLPKVKVKVITDEYIIIDMEGVEKKVMAGKLACTPRHGLSYAYSDAIIRLNTMTDEEIAQSLKRIVEIYDQMVCNYKDLGELWRNIPLGKEAFELMEALPDVIENEFDTPKEKASILSAIASYLDDYCSPRLCLEIAEYIKGLNPDDEENNVWIELLQDYLNTEFPMEEYCKKYEKTLKFDPVERTAKWEEVIYDVEKECAEILKDEPKGMGFCFSYWSTKKAVLGKYGIDWKSPSQMNPNVMFD